VKTITVKMRRTSSGRKVVTAYIGGPEYILLTVKRGPRVAEVLAVLSEQFGVHGVCGWPIDWLASDNFEELRLNEAVGAVGIYVPAHMYESLLQSGYNWG